MSGVPAWHTKLKADAKALEWHVDHIIPLSSAETEDEVISLNHFTNLRPMLAKDNRAKGDKITYLI